MREIRSLYRFIPFGKFSLSGRGRPPFNQVYVGRQKERSNFIELLTHQEKFGAFLISGHRGAGKSSFVEYCLNEYEKMAFQRSIRISRSSQFMSLFNLTMVAFLLIACYVLLSQFLELAAQNTFEALLSESISRTSTDGLASSRVLWMIAPLFLGSIVMLLPAYMVIKTAGAIGETEDAPWERRGSYWLSLALMGVIPIGWLAAWQFGAKVEVKYLFFGFVWMLVPLMTMSQLVQVIGQKEKYNRDTLIFTNKIVVCLTIFAGAIALFFKNLDLADVWASTNLYLLGAGSGIENRDQAELLDEAGITLIFYTLTYICLGRLTRTLITGGSHKGMFWFIVLGSALSAGLYFGTSLTCPLATVGIFQAGSGFESCQTFLARFIGLCPLLIFLIWIKFGIQPEQDKSKIGLPFAPVRTILIFKANFFIFLTALGLLPLIRVLSGFFILLPAPSNYLDSSWLRDFFVDRSKNLPHLAETHIEAWAFLAIFAVAMLIYRCEFLWICRDLRSFRQDNALGLLGRAKSQPDLPRAWPGFSPPEDTHHSWDWLKSDEWHFNSEEVDASSTDQGRRFTNLRKSVEASPLVSLIRKAEDKGLRRALIAEQFGASRLSSRSRHVFRKLETVTLPYWIYSVRHPVMKVWINLGFDNLEHSRIVEAMLRRLRGAYRRRFIGLTSLIGGMNALFLIGAAVLVTSLASKSIFHIGNPSEYTRTDNYSYRFEGNTVTSRDSFGATNYCGFFEVYPEIAPVAKSFVCALPFANGILELLYAPVLQIHTDFRSEVPVHQIGLTNEQEQSDGLKGRIARCRRYSESTALDLSKAITGDKPIAYVDWSGCLGHEKDVSDDLYRMFVGKSVAKGADASENFRRPIVGASELVRFILDPNIGLPLIDYETNINRTTLWKATWLTAFSPYPDGQQGTPTLRVYHLLLYVLAFMFLFALNRRLRVLPYQSNIDAMDELILLINGRETLQTGDQKPNGFWGALWPFRKQERTVETAGDPRVVEQRFIELLDRMRPHQPSYKDGPLNIFEVCPEITFVFDEMDKLSGIVDPELSKEAEGQTQLEENNRERARSLQLHQLLSDMKRLISGNSARFIFIGGRLYHDEWLADQAQRAPILNSIFSGQIYLPSLMADRSHTFGRMNDRIIELVVLMYRNARHRYHTWRGLRRAGPFIPSGASEEPSYVQFELPFSSHPRRLSALAHLVDMRVVDATGNSYSVDQGSLRASGPKKTEGDAESMGLGEQETFDQFINFLTYRSAGNPKKLKELIQSMIQTSSHAFALSRYPHKGQADVRWNKMRENAHDVITLNDSAIYRIQFIDMLYRHLTDHIEGRMLERDDKVSMSIFYLMDFLMKFHNRGFSRTNLQRVDELSHIHRAPDLRSVMSLLVQVSSERFLHRVQNGVYNFRFRSDFAREIDYLSRISKEEMAALNFTLDESQSLKGLYQQTINTGERENIDTVSGLGELYEYDQEYEIARNYYRRAIAMLDDVQAKSIMSKAVRHTVPEPKDTSWMAQLQAKDGETDAGRSYGEFGLFGDLLVGLDQDKRRKLIVSQVHWVVARLRLMLQVGQTYEQEQNFERANASYMHSARFSDIVLDALAQDLGNPEQVKITRDDLVTNGTGLKAAKTISEFWIELFGQQRSIPLVVLRNLSIFYQSGFAAAWVLEKDPENIDDSVVYAESWVKRMYDREPLLRFALPESKDYPVAPPFSGNILIQGALAHDRLGDLYFMKGQQSMKSVPFDVIVESVEPSNDEEQLIKRTGYMMRAQYNYAMSLWLLRKYLTNRNRISKASWLPLKSKPSEAEPFENKSITSSQFHITYADTLTDLAEAILATRSALRLSRDLCFPKVDPTYKQFCGVLTFDDLEKYRRCLRALVNGGIVRFNDNLIAPNAHDRADATALYWVHVPKDTGDVEFHSETGPTPPKTTPMTERDDLLNLQWIKFCSDENAPVHREIITTRWNDINTRFRNHMLRKNLTFGKISQWVGRRRVFHTTEDENSNDPPHMDGLLIQSPSTEMERLMGYKFFSQAAARGNQDIGQSTNSSHEYFLQADALNTTLWDARIMSHLYQHKKRGSDDIAAERFVLDEFFKKIVTDEMSKTRSDEDLFHIGLLSLTSILDAVNRIQFSDRPSTTRLALNHGNPDRNDGLMEAEGKSARELRADYDMAQAFRDDPRAITHACSLVLALLDEDAGRLCVNLALKTYKDVLMKYAYDTFKPNKDDELGKILTDCLNSNRDLPGWSGEDDHDTSTRAQEDKCRFKKLRKALYRETYAGLCVSLERYRYPILNRLNGLKTLADALLLQNPEDKWDGGLQDDQQPTVNSTHLVDRFSFGQYFGTERNSQIARLVRELAITGDVYGSDMHFPVDRAGQTMALTYLHMRHYGLHAIYDDMIADPPEANEDRYKFLAQDIIGTEYVDKRPLLNETVLTRESIGEMAVNRLSRSNEATSMGDSYYENVGYLNYLNDDFNDRSIHYYHATSMAHADLSELLSLMVKAGFR